MELTNEQLETIEKRAVDAFRLACRLAQDPQSFQMSIPARDDDSDRLLTQVTEDVQTLSAALRRERDARERAEAELRGVALDNALDILNKRGPVLEICGACEGAREVEGRDCEDCGGAGIKRIVSLPA